MGPSIQSSSQAAGRLVMFNSKFDGGVYMAERNSGYEPIESIYTRVFTRESGYWDESRGNFGGAYLVPLNSSKTYAWSGLPLLAGRWMRIFEWTLWPTIMGFRVFRHPPPRRSPFWWRVWSISSNILQIKDREPAYYQARYSILCWTFPRSIKQCEARAYIEDSGYIYRRLIKARAATLSMMLRDIWR